jgi:hypothetical protein
MVFIIFSVIFILITYRWIVQSHGSNQRYQPAIAHDLSLAGGHAVGFSWQSFLEGFFWHHP